MKVLHVTDASAAGVLSSITSLARAQARDDDFNEVRVAYTPRPASPTHEEICRGLGPNVKCTRWATTPSGALMPLITGLRRELQRDHFDVIHLHSSRAGLIGRLLSIPRRRRRSRLVYTPHGFAFDRRDFPKLLRVAYWLMELIGLSGSRSLILVSESERRLARRWLPGAKLAVLPNVVDVPGLDRHLALASARAQSPAAAPAAEQELVVVHLGRIAPHKRPELFSEIAGLAHRRWQGSIRFRWIGAGDPALLHPGSRPEPSCSPTPPGHQEGAAQIEITGWRSRDELADELRAAHIMLFTSWAEGLPLGILEAQAFGLPIIASNVTGVRDIVDDGANGYLIDTAQEAIAALERLLDSTQRDTMGQYASQWVLSRFGMEGLASRSIDVYTQFKTGSAIR